MWCLSMNFRGIDRSELIPRLHHWFWPKISWTAISAKQSVESSAFVRRLGRQGCQTFAIGLTLWAALSRCPSLSKIFATVRHVGQRLNIYPKIDLSFIRNLPVACWDSWVIGAVGQYASLEGKDHTIDPRQWLGGFASPPLRERGNFNFLARFYFKLQQLESPSP